MPEFEEMLAAVRTDCAARPLPPAEQVRGIGSRRTHRRRMFVTGTVAAAVTGVAVAAALTIPGGAPSRQPVGPTATLTSPAPSATPASSAPSGTSAGGAPPACRADQLGPTPVIHPGAAGGSLGIRVTFTNQSTVTCRLDDFVVLWHTEPGSPAAAVPTSFSGTFVPVLAPGGQGTALIQWTDGYGGYPSSAPECAKPAHYHDLSLTAGGARFALPGITLDVLCGSVFANWEGP